MLPSQSEGQQLLLGEGRAAEAGQCLRGHLNMKGTPGKISVKLKIKGLKQAAFPKIGLPRLPLWGMTHPRWTHGGLINEAGGLAIWLEVGAHSI